MAARGSESKEKIIEEILKHFNGAFKYDKEIRIPMVENGEQVQIKVTLTCAKTNVGQGEDTAMPGEAKPLTAGEQALNKTMEDYAEPTEEELHRVADLFASLGL